MSVTHNNMKMFIVLATSFRCGFDPSSDVIQEKRYPPKKIKLQFWMEFFILNYSFKVFL